MKSIALCVLFSLLTIQSLAVVCNDENCCVLQQNGNPTDGNGYQEYNPACLPNGGLHCVANTGCQLCWKPIFAQINLGSRPVCGRFISLSSTCNNQSCCEANENGNPTDGNGFLEFNPACLPNGGLHCVSNTGCQLCYKPVLGSTNVGDRPICARVTFNIKNLNSAKYASVQGISLSVGAFIRHRNNPTQPQAQWYKVLVPLTSYYLFQNVYSELYLSVQPPGNSDGDFIIQSNSVSSISQWNLISTTPAGYYFFKNVNSGFYLSVLGASTLNGASIIQSSIVLAHSKWALIPV
jgi:hypothetical protein